MKGNRSTDFPVRSASFAERQVITMKKHIIIYAILFVILFLLLITKGIPYGIVFHENNRLGYPDGAKTTQLFLIFNALIILVCFVLAIINTCHKANRIPFKWGIPIVMAVIIAFLPIIRIEQTGGIIGRPISNHYSIITWSGL